METWPGIKLLRGSLFICGFSTFALLSLRDIGELRQHIYRGENACDITCSVYASACAPLSAFVYASVGVSICSCRCRSLGPHRPWHCQLFATRGLTSTNISIAVSRLATVASSVTTFPSRLSYCCIYPATMAAAASSAMIVSEANCDLLDLVQGVADNNWKKHGVEIAGAGRRVHHTLPVPCWVSSSRLCCSCQPSHHLHIVMCWSVLYMSTRSCAFECMLADL